MPAHGKTACAHGLKNWLLHRCQHYHKQTIGATKRFSQFQKNFAERK